jgi:hypothetical protein
MGVRRFRHFLELKLAPVARELAPARLRSSRKTEECGVPDKL